MDMLFCIIPHTTSQQQAVLEMKFEPDITLTEKVIQDMALQVYFSALRVLPAVCNKKDIYIYVYIHIFDVYILYLGCKNVVQQFR